MRACWRALRGGGQYHVINLGISGYTLYEQFLLYASLIYPLAPEIVISFFFGVDVIAGRLNCEMLLRDFYLLYSPPIESFYKNQTKSALPLYHQLSKNKAFCNPNIQTNDILEALSVRLGQFYDLVVSNGGVFVPVITPLLHCKKIWTKEEKEGFQKTFDTYPKYHSFERDYDKRLISEFKQRAHRFCIYDANEFLSRQEKTLFLDWIHPNAAGNEEIARFLLGVLQGL